jgi:hypothetical protein
MGGKRKGKVKFRNADEARKARELAESWSKLQDKWGVTSSNKRKQPVVALDYKLSTPAGRTTPKIKSLDTGHTGAVTVKQIPQYTGTKILGIGTMHKSNAVPIFSGDEAKDISTMRRG